MRRSATKAGLLIVFLIITSILKTPCFEKGGMKKRLHRSAVLVYGNIAIKVETVATPAALL